MADSVLNLLNQSLINQSRLNDSINYQGLLDLMTKYPVPPQKKHIANDQDFIEELEQFLEHLDQPTKKKFYEESMIYLDDNHEQSSIPAENWLQFDDFDDLEKILQLS